MNKLAFKRVPEPRLNTLRWLVTALSLVLVLSASGQDQALGNWAMYFGKHTLNDKLSIHSEIQYRSRSVGLDNVEQILPRVGLNWHVSSTTTITGGYAYIPSYPDPGEVARPSVRENRIWQQLILVHKDKRLKFEHRYRFEQRWFPDDFRLRLRYRLMATYPLNKPDFSPGAWFIGVYNEVFLNTERTFFDRNRFYGAAGYVLNSTLSFQAGLLHQEVQNTGGKLYLQFAVFLTNDFRKSKDN